MSKTPQSTLDAINRYNTKSKYIKLKYTPNQIVDYEQIVKHCSNNGLSLQGYVKGLIKADLEKENL